MRSRILSVMGAALLLANSVAVAGQKTALNPPLSAREQANEQALRQARGASFLTARCVIAAERQINRQGRYDRVSWPEDLHSSGSAIRVLRWERPFSQDQPIIVSTVHEISAQARRQHSQHWDTFTLRCGGHDRALEALELIKQPSDSTALP